MAYNFYIYITTNSTKKVLYIGFTNDPQRSIYEHEEGVGEVSSFTKRYNCHRLIYYEHFTYVDHAIEREKEIKKWRREKKDNLISEFNPEWKFLNDEIKEW